MVDVAIQEGINVSHNLGGTCFYGLPIPKVRPHQKRIMLSAKTFITSLETAILVLYVPLL